MPEESTFWTFVVSTAMMSVAFGNKHFDLVDLKIEFVRSRLLIALRRGLQQKWLMHETLDLTASNGVPDHRCHQFAFSMELFVGADTITA